MASLRVGIFGDLFPLISCCANRVASFLNWDGVL